MSDEGDEHLQLIARWVHGEVVNNRVGIKVHGGPFHGRTRIVELDEHRQPPAQQRARGSRKHPPTDAWHVYELKPATDATAGWSYNYVGTEPYDAAR
ncbi:hypothetical protein AB0J38_27865 [Streptomyces sp. NPDC050095]|uniref:hypothetical protein n=1 Tax=unclassified Streptomyces TaxID=2593676 RepID=UPI0034203CD5